MPVIIMMMTLILRMKKKMGRRRKKVAKIALKKNMTTLTMTKERLTKSSKLIKAFENKQAAHEIII